VHAVTAGHLVEARPAARRAVSNCNQAIFSDTNSSSPEVHDGAPRIAAAPEVRLPLVEASARFRIGSTGAAEGPAFSRRRHDDSSFVRTCTASIRQSIRRPGSGFLHVRGAKPAMRYARQRSIELLGIREGARFSTSAAVRDGARAMAALSGGAAGSRRSLSIR